MMNNLLTGKTGFAVISALVLLAIVIYTVVKLRKQVSKREREEKEKTAKRLNKRHPQNRSGHKEP